MNAVTAAANTRHVTQPTLQRHLNCNGTVKNEPGAPALHTTSLFPRETNLDQVRLIIELDRRRFLFTAAFVIHNYKIHS